MPIRRLPNGLSLACLVLGFFELGAVLGGRPGLAPVFLLLALLADGLAGQVAWRKGLTTPLGAELDSLASLMAFGVSATVFAFEQSLRQLEVQALGWLLGLAFAVAAALKLSRDNASSPDWPRYQGLPVPAFGTFLVLAASRGLPPWFTALAGLGLAAAMLSPLRYPRFASTAAVQAPLGLLVLVCALFPPARDLLLALVLLYAVAGPFSSLWGLLREDLPPAKAKAKARRR